MQAIEITCPNDHVIGVAMTTCDDDACMAQTLAKVAILNPPCPTCGYRDEQPLLTPEQQVASAGRALLEASTSERTN